MDLGRDQDYSRLSTARIWILCILPQVPSVLKNCSLSTVYLPKVLNRVPEAVFAMFCDSEVQTAGYPNLCVLIRAAVIVYLWICVSLYDVRPISGDSAKDPHVMITKNHGIHNKPGDELHSNFRDSDNSGIDSVNVRVNLTRFCTCLTLACLHTSLTISTMPLPLLLTSC